MYDRTTYFDLYYDVQDEALIKDLRRTIDTAFERILSDFDLPVPDERYSFFLCRDAAEYITRTGKTAEEYEEWMVGWADYRLRKLCILSPRVVADKPPEEMRKVVIHEIVHLALDSLRSTDETEIFLAEGIAVAYAGGDDLFRWIGEGFERDALEDYLSGESKIGGQNQVVENCT